MCYRCGICDSGHINSKHSANRVIWSLSQNKYWLKDQCCNPYILALKGTLIVFIYLWSTCNNRHCHKAVIRYTEVHRYKLNFSLSLNNIQYCHYRNTLAVSQFTYLRAYTWCFERISAVIPRCTVPCSALKASGWRTRNGRNVESATRHTSHPEWMPSWLHIRRGRTTNLFSARWRRPFQWRWWRNFHVKYLWRKS